MDTLLYIIALLLVVIWAIGFFIYSLGALIHFVLVLAALLMLLKLIKWSGKN